MLETSDAPKNQHRSPTPESGPGRRGQPSAAFPAGQVLLPLLGFVGVTMIAILLRNVSFMSVVPADFAPYLGQPPAPHLTGILLSAYFVSSIVVSSHAIFTGTRAYPAWLHLGILSVFYFLYFCADALEGNLIAVLIAGSILLGLEHLRARADHRRAHAEGCGGAD